MKAEVESEGVEAMERRGRGITTCGPLKVKDHIGRIRTIYGAAISVSSNASDDPVDIRTSVGALPCN